MNPRLLSLALTSMLVAIALPSRSIAEEVNPVDTPPATEESTLPVAPSQDAAAAEAGSQPVVRGSSSQYRRRYIRQNRRPPSVQEQNNAKDRNNWWFN